MGTSKGERNALESVAAYRNLFRSTKTDHPWTALDDAEFLRMLGAFRKDREIGLEGLSVAGLPMIGQRETILDGAAELLRRLPGAHGRDGRHRVG